MTETARKREHAVARLAKEFAVLVANVRAFYFLENQRRAGRASELNGFVHRTVTATGVSERKVRRAAENVCTENVPNGGEFPTRNSRWRIAPEELARVRAAVYSQSWNRSIPTLDSTMASIHREEQIHAGLPPD